jgi:hypothetical protein
MPPHAVERRGDSLGDVGIGHVVGRLEEIRDRGRNVAIGLARALAGGALRLRHAEPGEPHSAP